MRNLFDGQPIPVLLEHLKHPTDSMRHRTRVELGQLPTAKVIAATKVWMKQFEAVTNAAIVMGAAGFENGFIPTAGDYPCVCRFPGHGIMMRGVLKAK